MKFFFSTLCLLITIQATQAQTVLYPTDTLVDPSLFESSELLVNWEYALCPINVDDKGPTATGDTTYAPCYIVTYRDHYNTSIQLCPDNIDEVGGIGLFNDEPRLLDSTLFNDLEDEGSNIISNDDNYTIHYKNLTTGEEVDDGDKGAKYCIDADLYEGTNNTWYQQFQILLGPISNPSGQYNYHTAETIGVLKNGLILEHTPPSSQSTAALEGGIIPVDYCGWHPEPAGFGHFHAIPYGINVPLASIGVASDYHCVDISQQNNSGLAGFTFEGIPIYGPYDNGQTTAPSNLDDCNGHTAPTPEFPNGVYHYHASATEVVNNPPCRTYYAPLEDTRFVYGEWTGGTTGIENEVGSAFEVTVYPNPSSTSINISEPVDSYTIFDEQGKVTFEGTTETHINVADWSKGIYFITGKKGTKVFFENFVVQ